jgi:radical SAM-linked protein
MKVRIKFAKYGAMKFIGHLDMMRFFQKAIRRADIDIRYSEGFSPHQIMSFAAPLGVGLESRGEYLDIEVNSMTTTDEMKSALNRTMTEGVEILDVGILPDNAKNAMASVAAASYELRAKEGELGIPDIKKAVAGFFAQETIPYTKETKKSVVELDLKQGIYEMTVTDTSAIQLLVNASSSGNIKPGMVMEKLCAYAGVEILPAAYQVTRLETYTNLANEGEPYHLAPLSACCLS